MVDNTGQGLPSTRNKKWFTPQCDNHLKCRGDYVEKIVGQQYNEMQSVLVRSEKQ
jgi:hypothetical protein